METNAQLAKPVDRLVAGLIDFVIVLSIFKLGALIGFTVGLAYWFLRDALPMMNGQSIGKKLMKIKVLGATKKSLANDYKAAALRQLSNIVPFLNLYEVYLLVTTPNYQRFGDKLTQTVVVREYVSND